MECRIFLDEGGWDKGACVTFCIHPETGEWSEIERFDPLEDEAKIYSFDMKNNLAWCRIRGTEELYCVKIGELPARSRDIQIKERTKFILKDMEKTFYFDGAYQYRGDAYRFYSRNVKGEEDEWNRCGYGACDVNLVLGDWIYVSQGCFEYDVSISFLPRSLKLPQEEQRLVISEEQKQELLG